MENWSGEILMDRCPTCGDEIVEDGEGMTCCKGCMLWVNETQDNCECE